MTEYFLAIGGDKYGSGDSDKADIYKVIDGKVIADGHLELKQARRDLAVAGCGEYILALGGDNGGSTEFNTVDVFQVTDDGVISRNDLNLTLSAARGELTAVSCGEYILAMGGNNYSSAVDVFKVTNSGVEHITGHNLTLSKGRDLLASASCGNYIFALGGSSYSDVIDIFKVTDSGIEHITDHSLTLSKGRQGLAAASCGNYVFAMGGSAQSGTGINDIVDIFKVTNNNIERVSHTFKLSAARTELRAASCGNYVFAMGGRSPSPGQALPTIDIFKVENDIVSQYTDQEFTLKEARYDLGVASSSNYILAFGGRTDVASTGGEPPMTSFSNAIDVFQVR